MQGQKYTRQGHPQKPLRDDYSNAPRHGIQAFEAASEVVFRSASSSSSELPAVSALSERGLLIALKNVSWLERGGINNTTYLLKCFFLVWFSFAEQGVIRLSVGEIVEGLLVQDDVSSFIHHAHAVNFEILTWLLQTSWTAMPFVP